MECGTCSRARMYNKDKPNFVRGDLLDKCGTTVHVLCSSAAWKVSSYLYGCGNWSVFNILERTMTHCILCFAYVLLEFFFLLSSP